MPGSSTAGPDQHASKDDGTRLCEHEQAAQGQDGGGWVRALAVATFDVGTGHTLEQVRFFFGKMTDDAGQTL